ncbi:hypothetical protein [Actinokineospora sp. NBRC 105648]|uniref:hypothetical protein n=1 Tax=Actinokineospora sp. NBRC 105648 TaxID=3032206 RepID=UPI0024A38092|nr:hypothetical protein [Actinokineospora sp. NBRC 105648]GLZ37227.1 hypothetical protein Acsp05_08520 [Actinokineospora sp. NBRC 105648]
MFSYEFGTIEWMWGNGTIRLNLPGGVEQTQNGGYQEVVDVLTGLGRQGWDVATCAAGGNWLFWTLRRQH